jgi:predicted ribosome quality control (RQC) complex YloA/Tae2 family protein
MPLDVITLNAVTKELNSNLTGCRIEKVYQPEADEISLTIKSNRSMISLVISASPSHPRIHITTQKKENQLTAPAFCMLLRKYLIGGTIENIEIFNCDRIIKITIEARNELKDKIQYILMVELMGRYSNIILLRSDYIIVDAIRRIHLDQSTNRYILPNLTYELQPQNKIRLDENDKLLDFFSDNKNLSKDILMQNISGISKETATELLKSDNIYEELKTFYNINESDKFAPCVLKKNGEVQDFFIKPYTTIQGEYQNMDTINECLDYFYSIVDHSVRKQYNTKEITLLLKRLQNKTSKRIIDNKNKIAESDKCDIYKQYGELIISNIYAIKKGDDTLECYDYFNDKQIFINLDPQLSPSQNAQVYYKKYNKLKRAKEFANIQLEKLYIQDVYLKNIESSIMNCELKQEFNEIYNELVELSGVKKLKNQGKNKEKLSKPLYYKIDDFDVYVGKNSLQNVEVTFKIGENHDTWLHTKTYHGCHAIIKGNPDEKVIFKVAQIVAYFSEGRNSDKVEVDYTLRKFVKKIPASFVGLVSYTNYKTILVEPLLPDNI